MWPNDSGEVTIARDVSDSVLYQDENVKCALGVFSVLQTVQEPH
jgi:hypothetical protein